MHACSNYNKLLALYYNMLRSVDFRCRKELTAQFKGKQQPDIAVYDFQDGKKLLLDITITHPWAQSNISGSSTRAGFADYDQEGKRQEIQGNSDVAKMPDLYALMETNLILFVQLDMFHQSTVSRDCTS